MIQIALVAFVTNYIPNIGCIIGLVPPAMPALLRCGPRLALLGIAVYVVINFVIQSVIQPKFIGDAVELSLTLTFLSLVFGAVVAIPLTLLVKALSADVDPHSAWIGTLLTSSKPAPALQEG